MPETFTAADFETESASPLKFTPEDFASSSPHRFTPDDFLEADINRNARNLPNTQATTRGGPPLQLSDAGGFQSVIEGTIENVGEMLTRKEGIGSVIPRLAPSAEQVQGAVNFAKEAISGRPTLRSGDIEGFDRSPSLGAKVASGVAGGVEDLAKGVADFFTTPSGLAQLGASMTPVAPAVYAKWALDMTNAGFTSVQEAWKAFKESDYQKVAQDTTAAFGAFLGAAAAAKHGYKELTPVLEVMPRGDMRGVRVEEAQQKALNATLPAVLEQSNAPLTAQALKELPQAPLVSAAVAESGLTEKTPEAAVNVDIRGLAGDRVKRPLTEAESTSGLNEILPTDETTDIRRKPIELTGGSEKVQGQPMSQLESRVESEIGKEGAKGSLRGDWAEINADIESGMTREAALQKYMDELDASRKKSDAEESARNQSYQGTDEAKAAAMTPEEYKEKVARPIYDKLVSEFKPKKKGQQPTDFENWFKIGDNQENIIGNAVIHDAPINAKAAERFGVEDQLLEQGYVREGDLYVKKSKKGGDQNETQKEKRRQEVLAPTAGETKAGDQPKIESMGGANFMGEDFTPSQSMPTANKNASIDADRVARGEAPMVKAMRKTDPELFDEAMAVINRDWDAADKLIARFKEQPFTPTDVESMVLLHRRVDLKNEVAKLSREYASAKDEGRIEAAEAARASRDFIQGKFNELDAIVGRGNSAMGTMQGRAFRARQLLMNEDYSMASLISERQRAQGRKLTDSEIEKVRSLADRNAKLADRHEQRADELQKQVEELEAQAVVEQAAHDAFRAPKASNYVLDLAEKIAADWDKRADRARERLKEKFKRTNVGLDPTIVLDLAEIGLSHLGHAGLNFAKWSAKMLDEFKELDAADLKEVYAKSQELADADIAKRTPKAKAEAVKKTIKSPVDVVQSTINRVKKNLAKNENADISFAARKLAREFWIRGIREPQKLVDAVHEALKEADPDIERRETMDALSGYGKFKPLSKDEVAIGLRDVNGQLQQIAKLEDMAQGRAPKKSGFERRAPSDEERRLIKQVEEAKKKGGYDVTDPETQLRTSMQAIKARLRNQISDLETQISKREKIVKDKTPIEYDAEANALREVRDSLKKQFDDIFGKPEISDAVREKRAIAALEKSIAELEQKIAAGDFSVKPQSVNRPARPAVEELTQKREALSRQIAEARKKPESQKYAESLARQLEELNKKIAEKQAMIDSGNVAAVSTARMARPMPTPELEMARQQLDKLNETIHDLRNPPKTELEIAMRAAQTRLENQIAQFEKEIETRTEKVKDKRKLVYDDKLQGLKDRRDWLKKVRDDIFKKPELTDAERLQQWKERTQEKIDDYNEQVVSGYFKQRKRPEPIRFDPEAIKLRHQLNKVHRAVLDMRLKDELAKRNTRQKVANGVGNTLRFSRAIITGGEFSAVLRQGAFLFGAHPIMGAKAMKQMFQALMSEEAQFKIMEEIQTRPNAPLYERSKLDFTDAGTRLSSMEEHYMFRISENVKNIPGVKHGVRFLEAFQRAYTTYLNRVRADAFDKLVDTYGDNPVMTEQIANFINVATGRGSKGLGRWVGPGANTVFFAPRYTISRLQLLTGQPMWSGNLETRKMVATEYARALTGAAVVYSLGMAAGGSIETDPRSADFGKIKIGNTRIDPLAGLLQWTRLLAEEISGTRVNNKGKVRPLREDYRMGGHLPKRTIGEPSGLEVAGRFALTKVAPIVGIGANFMAGQNFTGQKFSFENELINAGMPITYGDIYKAMQEQGVPKGTAIALLAIFGMGVQTYDTTKRQQ